MGKKSKKSKARCSDKEKVRGREERGVYKSELKLKQARWGGRPKSADAYTGRAMALEECQAFIDSVMESQLVRERYGANYPIMATRTPTYQTSARASYRSKKGAEVDWMKRGRAVATIRLPLWARNEFVILHEVAHHLHSESYEFIGDKWRHDGEFASIYLKLLFNFGDRAEYERLKAAYIKNKVKFKVL